MIISKESIRSNKELSVGGVVEEGCVSSRAARFRYVPVHGQRYAALLSAPNPLTLASGAKLKSGSYVRRAGA